MGDSSEDVHDAQSSSFPISTHHDTTASLANKSSFNHPESTMKQQPCFDNPTDPSFPEYRMYVSNSVARTITKKNKTMVQWIGER